MGAASRTRDDIVREPSDSTTTTLTTEAAPAQTPAPSTWPTALHEIMAALVSLVLLVLAAVMLWETYATGRTPKIDLDAYARQKDVMLYGLTLLGTVTGYYLGRVPAERRADQAQQTATTAQRQLGKAQDRANDESVAREIAERKTADVRRELPRVRELVQAGLAASGAGAARGARSLDAAEPGPSGADTSRAALQQAASSIDALLMHLA